MVMNSKVKMLLTGNIVRKGDGQYSEAKNAEWNKLYTLTGLRLRFLSYVMFDLLQKYSNNLMDVLKQSGIYEESFPKKKNRTKAMKHGDMYDKDISYHAEKVVEYANKLYHWVQADERIYINNIGLADFPCYIHDFGQEGTMFLFALQQKYQDLIRKDADNLYYAVRRVIVNKDDVPEFHKEAAVAATLLGSYDYMYRNLKEFIVNEIAGIPICLTELRQFPEHYTNLNRSLIFIFRKLVGNQDCFGELTSDRLTECCQHIELKINSEAMWKNIQESLKETFTQYARYSVARMLLKVRRGEDITAETVYLVTKFNFNYNELTELQREFMRTRISLDGDAYDVAAHVPLMNAPLAHKFITQFVNKGWIE